MAPRLRWLLRAVSLLGLTCSLPPPCSAQEPPPQTDITFSHVYQIDLPRPPGCRGSVEEGPAPAGGDQGGAGGPQELQQGGASPNDVVFKHNIRLQTPACDCAESESFKSLLYRVNGLEEEVGYLKSQCSQGCCGRGGAAGVDTGCSGHGTYQQASCSCECLPGWEGPDCSASSCPDDCSDNGRCVDGRCVCHDGYAGEDCSVLRCPGDCNDKGRCVDGRCICFDHFAGEDCSVRRCPGNCAGNGRCVDGGCVCDEGFFGDDCSQVLGPQGLRVLRVTHASLLVEWEAVRGAEHYLLTYHAEGERGAMETVEVPNTENSYLITGLSSGVTYVVDVYAVVKTIQSGADTIRATTEVSGVSGVRVLGQTEQSIQVDWQNPEAELDHFRLTHASASAQGHEEENVPMSQEARTTHTIIGLHPGTEYLITVQGIKGSLEGKVSSVTGFTELDAPTNLVTREVTEDSASVTWDRVQASVDGYVLSYSSAQGPGGEVSVGDSASYRLTGLRPGVLYTVSVWAVQGARSSRKAETQAETELDAPTNLVTRGVTEASASVTWDRVQASVDGYVLSYSSALGPGGEVSVGDSASYRLTGLRPGVLYTVYVWAVQGSRSSRKASTQAETDLDAPTNLVTRGVTEDSASVTWDRVQASVDGYVLSYSSAQGPGGEVSVGDSASYRLTGLRPGVLYTVYVWAVQGSRSSRKAETQAETEIDAPKNLKAEGVKTDSASVTWQAPLADIKGYLLTYRPEDGSAQTAEKRLGPRERFAMSGLETGKSYIVTLIAFRGAKRSKVVETIFRTEGVVYQFPMDCAQLLSNGEAQSGIYTIYINGNRSRAIEVYCDMDTDGGGWAVIQRRHSGKLDFMKRWRVYIQGFGNMTDEFWLGLDKIYELTNTPVPYELRVDLGLGSEKVYAVYDLFRIAPVKQKFRLTIGKYRGTAGDAMTYHNTYPFSTVDNDNDIALGNCALTHRGAWWYKNCHLANLNGRFGDNRHSMGVNWEPWKGHLMSLDATAMMIRPVGAGASRKRRSLPPREKSRAAHNN